MTIPSEVLHAYGWTDGTCAPLAGGLINQTFLVRRADAPVAVVQRLHPVFGADVNLDIDAVTTHLARKGEPTPRLVRTTDDRGWVVVGDAVWRAITYLEGDTFQAVPDLAIAEAGGALVGRFHRAVADLTHAYHFVRPGVHDTSRHLARLEDDAVGTTDQEGADLAHDILDVARSLPLMPATPRRHCHGDLKISNLLFRAGGGLALVDLDTVGTSTLAFELGDAMRSWCNPLGEDVTAVRFDLAIFDAAMRGFRSVGAPVVDAEWRSIVVGLETVAVELAARFAVDVFRDDYFGWNAARYPSRRAHNLVRARGQLALARSIREARADALAIVAGT
ncbi:MAG: phosphotransferase [Proteobacteria bacterium]|nr:phosphotransferase [Pseudomonadota bacterium]